MRGPDSSDSQHVSVCRQPSTRVVVTTPDTECPTIHTGGHCLPWKRLGEDAWMGRPAVLVEGWDTGLEAKALANTKGQGANRMRH